VGGAVRGSECVAVGVVAHVDDFGDEPRGNERPLCQRLVGRWIAPCLFRVEDPTESVVGTLLGGGCGGTPQRRAGC